MIHATRIAVLHAAAGGGATGDVVVVVWAWQIGLVTMVRGRFRLLALAVRVVLRALYTACCQLVGLPVRRTGPHSWWAGWQPKLRLLASPRRPRAPPPRRPFTAGARRWPPAVSPVQQGSTAWQRSRGHRFEHLGIRTHRTQPISTRRSEVPP